MDKIIKGLRSCQILIHDECDSDSAHHRENARYLVGGSGWSGAGQAASSTAPYPCLRHDPGVPMRPLGLTGLL